MAIISYNSYSLYSGKSVEIMSICKPEILIDAATAPFFRLGLPRRVMTFRLEVKGDLHSIDMVFGRRYAFFVDIIRRICRTMVLLKWHGTSKVSARRDRTEGIVEGRVGEAH